MWIHGSGWLETCKTKIYFYILAMILWIPNIKSIPFINTQKFKIPGRSLTAYKDLIDIDSIILEFIWKVEE
jgi:hypothetical protein